METFNLYMRGEVVAQKHWLESWKYEKRVHSYVHKGVRKYRQHRCPLCPFHVFRMHPCNFRKNYNRHLEHEHAITNNVTHRSVELSCTRSVTVWRAAREIFDGDSMCGQYNGHYLRRASELFRKTVRIPTGQRMRTSMDRKVHDHRMILVLGDNGQIYCRAAVVATGSGYRRLSDCTDAELESVTSGGKLRSHYYTKGFAELFIKAMLLHTGSIPETRRELVRTFATKGNPLANMLPVEGGGADNHKF